MPAALNALSGNGVHVLTFNDYLARRDAEWMRPIYESLGLRVSFIQQGMTPAERRRAYLADVTYLTAKEAGFDHLRDLLVTSPEDLVHRPFHFALVDEADSILIDEARSPLVIAGRVGRATPSGGRLADPWPRSSLASISIRTSTGATWSSRKPASNAWRNGSDAGASTESRTTPC